MAAMLLPSQEKLNALILDSQSNPCLSVKLHMAKTSTAEPQATYCVLSTASAQLTQDEEGPAKAQTA